MKLRRVQVQNFRSIVDSGAVDIGEGVTVLIGKNEQGKSNFLKALTSFNPNRSYTPNDLPKHLRTQLEEKDAAGIAIVTIWVVPEQADRVQLKEALRDVATIDEFRISRYYDGHYEYQESRANKTATLEFSKPDIAKPVEDIKELANGLKTKLEEHSKRLPSFAPAGLQANVHIDQFVKSDFSDASQIENIVRTFVTLLTGLPGQDQTIQEDISTTANELQVRIEELQQALKKDPMAIFQRRIPHFLFHSSRMDRIPNEVNVAEFVADPEKISKGMANLCGAAGLTIQKIKELAAATDASQREVYEDQYRTSISGAINEFWTQESYDVYFRFEKEKLSVSISDDTYSFRTAPSDRSDGFQWYLSFYCALRNEVSTTETRIVLLDNPALELHADGQRDIKRFLEERLAPTTQVIYVTHSPAMIDPFNLEQLRKVELQSGIQGTKVSGLIVQADSLDLLEPVRSAVGASLVSSLVFNDFNVLVEGAADKPILEGAFMLFLKDKSKNFLVNGPVSESKAAFLPRFYKRTGLPFVVVLDADSSGRDLAGALKKWDIPDSKILELGSVFSDSFSKERQGNDFELEDILSDDFYYQAVNETYPKQKLELKIIQQDGSLKRTNAYQLAYKKHFGLGFNNRRVAETIKKMLLDGKADKVTRARLQKLTDAIVKKLDEQVSTKNTP